MDRSLLEKKQLAELREIASTLDLRGYHRMKKADLVDLIMDAGGATNGTGNGGGSRGAETDTETDTDADTASEDRDGGDDGSSRSRGDGANDDASNDDRGGRNRNKQRRRKGRDGTKDQDLEGAEVREGVLDLLPEGYGFLRTTGYLSGSRDVYVSQSYVRRFHLRRGDLVRGPIRSNNRGNDKFPALARVDAIEGLEVDDHLDEDRPDFDELTPVHPTARLALGGDDAPMVLQAIDRLVPLGRGQRGLVVSPPRAGRTTLLREVARAVEAADADVEVMVLLVDERPEEVTDFERAIDGEVVSSTFDRPAEDHTAVAELALERAKRLVERGRDVVVLVDSLTRLARAYNLASSGSGRTLAGGLDAGALYPVKRFLGAARNVDGDGSLTMLATVLTETGAALDEVVLDELAGTANSTLRLHRLADPAPVFPAFDVAASLTIRDEDLLDADDLEAARKLRTELVDRDVADAMATLADRLS